MEAACPLFPSVSCGMPMLPPRGTSRFVLAAVSLLFTRPLTIAGRLALQETLFPVTAEGTVTISSSCAITAKPHQKLAVVAFVTPTDAMKYNTYAEMKANAVPMLPAGGFFDVLAASSEGEVA